MTLDQLSYNQKAKITGFDPLFLELETRLREIGFSEGDEVTVLHFGPIGKNPMSIKLNGALIALRKNEAKYIFVKLL
jgi:ferrous iron transport protein A